MFYPIEKSLTCSLQFGFKIHGGFSERYNTKDKHAKVLVSNIWLTLSPAMPG